MWRKAQANSLVTLNPFLNHRLECVPNVCCVKMFNVSNQAQNYENVFPPTPPPPLKNKKMYFRPEKQCLRVFSKIMFFHTKCRTNADTIHINIKQRITCSTFRSGQWGWEAEGRWGPEDCSCCAMICNMLVKYIISSSPPLPSFCRHSRRHQHNSSTACCHYDNDVINVCLCVRGKASIHNWCTPANSQHIVADQIASHQFIAGPIGGDGENCWRITVYTDIYCQTIILIILIR